MVGRRAGRGMHVGLVQESLQQLRGLNVQAGRQASSSWDMRCLTAHQGGHGRRLPGAAGAVAEDLAQGARLQLQAAHVGKQRQHCRSHQPQRQEGPGLLPAHKGHRLSAGLSSCPGVVCPLGLSLAGQAHGSQQGKYGQLSYAPVQACRHRSRSSVGPHLLQTGSTAACACPSQAASARLRGRQQGQLQSCLRPTAGAHLGRMSRLAASAFMSSRRPSPAVISRPVCWRQAMERTTAAPAHRLSVTAGCLGQPSAPSVRMARKLMASPTPLRTLTMVSWPVRGGP